MKQLFYILYGCSLSIFTIISSYGATQCQHTPDMNLFDIDLKGAQSQFYGAYIGGDPRLPLHEYAGAEGYHYGAEFCSPPSYRSWVTDPETGYGWGLTRVYRGNTHWCGDNRKWYYYIYTTAQTCPAPPDPDSDGDGTTDPNDIDSQNTDPKYLGLFPQCPQPYKGNPVNIFNGNNFEQENDLSFNSPFKDGLAFKRYYNSRSSEDSAMGFGWTHNYNIMLHPNYSGSDQLIEILDSSGRGIYFDDNDQDGVFTGAFAEKSTITRDADNNYIWIRHDGTVCKFAHTTGLLLSVTDRYGNVQTLSYNGSLLETITEQASGRALTLSYNADNKISSISGPVTTAVPDGIWVTYSYDTNDNLIKVEYADDGNGSLASGFEYLYEDTNDPNNMTSKKDLAGVVLSTWTYNTNDQAVSNVNNQGTGVSISYNSPTEVVVTDAYGIASTYSIAEIAGRKMITQTTKPNGCTTCAEGIYQSQFDATTGFPTQREYYNGRIDLYQSYDAIGNPGTIVIASGSGEEKTVSKTYHPVLSTPLTITEKSVLADDLNPGRNKITIYDYDDPADPGNTVTPNENPTNLVYRLIQQGYTLDASGGVVSFENITAMTYNAKGQVASIDGPLTGTADTLTYAYDAATGDLVSVTSPVTGSVTFEYDGAGNMTRFVDQNSIITLVTYDGRNRQMNTTTDGKTSAKTYTVAGLIKSVTNRVSQTLNYGYDSNGHLLQVTDPAGDYMSYTYDANANLIQESAHSSAGTRTFIKKYDYGDPATNSDLTPGKPWKSIDRNQVDTEDLETVYHYAHGKVTQVSRPGGGQTDIDYDILGRQTQQTEKLTNTQNAITVFTYDHQDNLVSVTDANQNTTTYVFDDMGRMVKQVSPDTGTTYFTYDGAGNMLTKKTNNGKTTIYTYDALNRPISIEYEDTSQDVVFLYDTGINGNGRLTGISDAFGNWQFTYDSQGNRIREEKTSGGLTFTISYTYDSTGRLLTMTYPDSRVVTYDYNDSGRVNRVTTTQNGITKVVADALTYLPFGPVRTMAFGNSMIQEKTFDLQYRPGDIITGDRMNLTYGYDPAGNIISINDNLDPSKNRTFSYDFAGRLTSASNSSGNFSYTHDPVGNRLSRVVNSIRQQYEYLTESNKLSTVTQDSVITSFTYDDNGNMTSKGDVTYTYFQNNRLASVMKDGITLADYLYDSQGRRTRKNSDCTQIVLHYDLSGNLIAESDTDGNILKSYIYLGTQRIAVVEAEQDSNFAVTVGTADGIPLQNIKVYLFTETGAYAGIFATTNENGEAMFEKSLFTASAYKFRADYLNEHFWSPVVSIDSGTTSIEINQSLQTVTIIQGGTPLSGIKVYLFDEAGRYLGLSAVTDENGKVYFNLPQGHQYKFRADIMGGQYFSDLVTIGDEPGQVSLDSRGGTITFTLTRDNTAPMAGIKTYLFSESGTYLGQTRTTSAAGVCLYDVPDGTYKIRCDYLGCQFWTGTISVAGDANTSLSIPHQDVTVSVSQVFRSSKDPAANVRVYLFSESGTYLGVQSVTDNSGNSVFSLPAKAYKIRADFLNRHYWSGAFTWEDQQINISRGRALITVTNQGNPLTGIKTYLFNESGTYLGINATTSVDGKTTFILPAGTYRFRADWMGNRYWSGLIQVQADQDIPVALSTGGGTISLTVKMDAQTVLEGVKTYLFNSTGTYLGESRISDSNGRVAFPVGDGIYKIRCDYLGYQFWTPDINIPGSLNHQLEIPHQEIAITVNKTFNSETGPLSSVKLYLFTESGTYMGQYRTSDETGRVLLNLPQKAYKVRADFLNQQYWSNSFTWTDQTVSINQGEVRMAVKQNEIPLPDVTVYLFSEQGAYLGINGKTDSSGNIIFRMPEGTYKFRADYLGSQFWGSASIISDTILDATIDAGGGTFDLIIQKSAGDPLSGIKIYAFSDTGSYLGLNRTSDDTGNVSFDLPTGSYKFRADYFGYQFWTGTFAVPGTTSSVLTIPHQDVTTTINSQYEATAPIQGVKVYLFTGSGSYQGKSATTGTTGTAMFSVPHKPYKIRADYLSGQFWSQVFTGTDTTILIDHAKAMLNVTMAGESVPGARVYLFNETGTYLSRFDNTDNDGKADFFVPKGTYKFRVDHNGTQYWTDPVNIIAFQENTIDINLDLLASNLTADPHYARFDGMPPVKEKILLASTGSDVPQATGDFGGHVMFFFINNHLGTPMMLVGDNGEVVWSAEYTPFGNAEIAPGSRENNFRFPGQYYDSETGLHYNWHRYYDPGTGRFLTPDPIGLGGGINLYAYVDNNPTIYIDPTGLYRNPWEDIKINPERTKIYYQGYLYAFQTNAGYWIQASLELNPKTWPNKFDIENRIMHEIANEQYKQNNIDTLLSAGSVCAAGGSLAASGGTSLVLFGIGASLDTTSAIRKDDPTQAAPILAGLLGKKGEILGFLGSAINALRGIWDGN